MIKFLIIVFSLFSNAVFASDDDSSTIDLDEYSISADLSGISRAAPYGS